MKMILRKAVILLINICFCWLNYGEIIEQTKSLNSVYYWFKKIFKIMYMDMLILWKTLKTLWFLFMDEIQLSQGYRVTPRRQFTFYH